MSQRISRRTLLRGAGAAMGLPLLEAMIPGTAYSWQGEPKAPVRMALYVVGGGAYMPYWTIDESGRREDLAPQKAVEYRAVAEERDEPLTALSPSLEPLEAYKEQLLVLGGLTLARSEYNSDDGHSPEIACLLTGAGLRGDRVQVGVSVDQFAARRLEGKTYLDSLVLGLEGARPGGSKGVGRVYAQHYSWRTATTPTGEERNPRLAFDRLFRGRAPGAASAGSAEAAADRKSVLDLVNEEAKRLRGTLGGADRQKLDEYLHAVRDVEQRIDHAARRGLDPEAPSISSEDLAEFEQRIPEGSGIPESYEEYDRLMVDLIALAFQTDSTRVAVLTHGGYRRYVEVGVTRGHHDCQHHEGNVEKRNDLRKIDRYNVQLFAHVLERFQEIQEGARTLLDNAMVLYGSGMSNGNRHAPENLPILLAGRAGGQIQTGRYLDFDWKKRTPLSNLYVEMLNRVVASTAKFGDSTGGLPELG
jgi:hypothetical protein